VTNVFLAGPMRNVLNMNAEQFRLAASALRTNVTFDVWSPIEDDWEHGFDPRGYGTAVEMAERMFDFRAAFARNVNRLCTWANVVAVLSRWEKSDGAKAQVMIARRLDIPCYTWKNLAAGGLDMPQITWRQW
jgi:hypothetical protein